MDEESSDDHFEDWDWSINPLPNPPFFPIQDYPSPFNPCLPLLSKATEDASICNNSKFMHPKHNEARRLFSSLVFFEAETEKDLRFQDLVQRNVPMLDILQAMCLYEGIHECGNESCKNWRNAMWRAPKCDWTLFRDWVIAKLACRFNAGVYNSGMGSGWSRELMQQLTNHATPPDIDISDVYELVEWVSIIDRRANHSLEPTTYPDAGYHSKISEARQLAARLGICPWRLENITKATSRSAQDLPAILSLASQGDGNANFRWCQAQDRHNTCSASHCVDSQMDTTLVSQAHKCLDGACKKLVSFPPDEFSNKTDPYTWWSQSGEGRAHIVQRDYVAISHVWSDGTGVGLGQPGLVNKCLFEYIKRAVQELGYSAIWWDTISIPMESDTRSRTVAQMHRYYNAASCVLVHDEYLVRFPWADDGSPCLALLLSPWFTRGWTALELVKARSGVVFIIFQHPHDPSLHVIKSLHKEVLTDSPMLSSFGHLLGSEIVRNLRQIKAHTVTNTLRILAPRFTSREKDRVLIAALLGNHEIDYRLSPVDMTHALLQDIVMLPASFLLHGRQTLTESGGYSWCAASWTSLAAATVEGSDSAEVLMVDDSGAACGNWHCRPFGRGERASSSCRPHTADSVVASKVRKALAMDSSCLLLRPASTSSFDQPGLSLLVMAMGLGTLMSYPIIDCQYVGMVMDELDWIGRSQLVSVRLGAEPSHQGQPGDACGILTQYPQDKLVEPVVWEHLIKIHRKVDREFRNMTRRAPQITSFRFP